MQKMNVSEQRTDWPPYLRLQVSDLMMGGGGGTRGVVATCLL